MENKGLSYKDELKELHISSLSNTISSFSEDWINSVQKSGRFKTNWDEKLLVQMTTIDKLIKKYGIPHYIKIDVEGYEYEVLRGLTIPIDYISFEFTLPEQLDKAILCADYLVNLNQNIEFNYALGTNEDLSWVLKNWVSINELKEILRSFKDLQYGDLYARIRK